MSLRGCAARPGRPVKSPMDGVTLQGSHSLMEIKKHVITELIIDDECISIDGNNASGFFQEDIAACLEDKRPAAGAWSQAV